MKLAKINKDVIIQYTCADCGQVVLEAEYGTSFCKKCYEPIDNKTKFYCIGEDKHYHKECYKNLKEES